MKNWQRKTLFSFFLILFLVFGPSLVLYSLGFRFDFEKKKLTQIGGIFIKAQPKEVTIFLDDKLIKTTDFFFGSALIENLLPKKYKIRIEKENYFSWEKELEVEEKKVTEIKNLILFPKNITFSPLSKNVEDFWLSPNGKQIILKEIEDEKWILKLYSIENKVKSYLVGEENISKQGAEILNLKFLENSNIVEIKVKIGEKIKDFSLDLTKTPQLKEIEKLKIPESILCYQFKNDLSYFFENSGFLFKGNLNFENKEKLNEIPLSISEKDRCDVQIFDGFSLLKINDDFFLLNQEKKSFEKIFEGIKGFKISPDFLKVALFSNSEIWLLQKTGEKIFLNRFSERIENLDWINQDYLIFQTQDKIKISEIDTRSRINVFNILEFEGKKFFFNQVNQKIYFLKDGVLFQSDSILR